MPRGRSTFSKRQKEQARQQKQRDKAQRRSERKQGGGADVPANEMDMDELRAHAEAQAALFRVGDEEGSGDNGSHEQNEEASR